MSYRKKEIDIRKERKEIRKIPLFMSYSQKRNKSVGKRQAKFDWSTI